jgi:glycogen(starch) synthase
MKLLVYSHFFAPSIGGVETIVLSLARGLAELRDANGAREFEVTLVTQTPAGNCDDSALPFRVVRQPDLFQLWRLIRTCDVVHVTGPALLPMVLGFLARKPVAIEHHGYQAICPNGLLVHQPDASICPGHFQAKHYRECLRCQRSELSVVRAFVSLLLMFPRHWLSRRAAANLSVSHHVLVRHALPRSSVIYHGTDDLLEEGSASPPEASAKLRFAYVGRFVPEKGIALLLQAASILRQEGHEFEVRLIGDGPLRPELESLIQSNSLTSCFQITGYLSGARLGEALRDVHVVVMPSVWEETAGLAAIEQMMRGRLVIASNLGGLCEVVGQAGLTFSAGSATALAAVMKMVMDNPDLIVSLGQRARDRSLSLFLGARMIKDHAHTYRDLINNSRL